MPPQPPLPRPTMRLDKWLWFARFFKTRGLATSEVASGHVRVNGTRTTRPAQPVGPGDVLTFAQGRQIRLIRVVALGVRRGSAPEAQALYVDLDVKPATDFPGKAASGPSALE